MIPSKHVFLFLLSIVFSLSITAQNFNMDGMPIVSCAGNFYDSGGASGGYGVNENFTSTICSDGSDGSHIQLYFSGLDLGMGDSIKIYDANTADPAFQFDNAFLLVPNELFIIQATVDNPSGCITIVFTSDNIDEGNLGWVADISCTSSCQTIEALLVSSMPAASPVDTGWIDICPGDEVFFEGAGNYLQNNTNYIQDDALSTFEWDFGDGTRAVGSAVSHTFNNPGGFIVQLTVTDQTGCSSTNFLNQRVRVSTFPTFELEGVRDSTICLGDSIMLSSGIDTMVMTDILARSNEGTFNVKTSISDTIKLPDVVGSFYESSLYFTQFAPGAVLENPEDLLFVLLNLEHSYYGDLRIELICPDGTSIDLLQRDNAAPFGTTNFGEPWAASPSDTQSSDCTQGCGYDYSFVNSSPNGTIRDVVDTLPSVLLTTKPSIETGTIYQYSDRTFPSGEYQSDTPFADLLGCPLNGKWTIRITDFLANDNGWLFNWSLGFSNHLFTNLETYTPVFSPWGWDDNPSVVSSTPNSIVANPENPGETQYTFWVMDDFGCRYDTTLVYSILPSSHPECLNCAIEINEQADLVLCEGDTELLDLSVSNSTMECIEFEQFPQYEIGAANHNNGTPYGSVFTVNSIHPDIITVPSNSICSVCIDLSTDVLSDITLTLESPNGSQILLTQMNGGNSSAGYVQTCFSPSALMEFSNGAPPYTGEFQPQDPNGWSAFINSPINGEWTLWVSDCCDLTQSGELINWSISFNNQTDYTYDWAPTPDLSCLDCSTPTLTATTSQNYIASITDNLGCQIIDTVSVQIIDDLAIPIVNCTAQNNGILFEWNPPPAEEQFEYRLTINGVPGNWVLAVDNMLFIDTFAHNDIVNIEVRILLSSPSLNCNIPTASSECTAIVCDLTLADADVTDASCFNIADGMLSINVTSGTLPYSYFIDEDPTVSDMPVFTDLSPGPHTYTVVNGAGCDIQRSFVIDSPDSLFVDGTQTFSACFGLIQNEATAIAGGGSGGGYLYNWSHGETGINQTMLAEGNYQITVTDSDGCMASNILSVDNLEPISFNFLTDPPTCFGLNDGGVGINQIIGGAGTSDSDYTYLWEDGSTSIVRTNLIGGMEYCVTVTDALGCQASQCRLLPEPEPIPIELAGISPSCKGSQDGQISIVTPALLDDYTISWSPNTGGQDTNPAVDLSAGTYEVTITNSDGCSGNSSFTLNDPSTLESNALVSNNDCFNYQQGSIDVMVNGGLAPYHYQWSHTVSDTAMVGNLLAGNYGLTITDDNGCMIEEAYTVSQPEEVLMDVVSSNTTCFGDRDGSIDISIIGGSPPFTYSLNGGDNFSTTHFIGLYAGVYNVQALDNNGCQIFAIAEVLEPDEFIIDIGEDQSISFGDPFPLSSSSENEQGEIFYLWQEPYEGTLSCLACPSPIATPEATIDYFLVATDSAGCQAQDQFRLFVDKNYVVEVPTGFTPNGDLYNDLLYVRGTPGVEIITFQVFDRWGEEVFLAEGFEVNDSSTGWDGNFRGQMYNGGVFIWQLQVKYPDGKEETLAGQTTLIR